VNHVVIVGAGILGTMHAIEARRRGWSVTLIDRDAEPRSATVRNFGLVWVSGRAPGDELQFAVRARARWEELAGREPGVGFRPDGSVTVALHPAEVEVMRAVCDRPDSSDRGFELLDPAEIRRVNPALRGDALAGLWSRADAVVEPGQALPALRRQLDGPSDRFVGGRTVVAVDSGSVLDHAGERHAGDLVIVCPGAEHHAGPIGDLLHGAPLQRVMLQMMQTEPLGERLATSVADGDSLRYYPAFDVPERADLPPADPIVAELGIQLLVSQRAGGELTVGDTHSYDEPFDFACDERPYEHLRTRLGTVLGQPAPPVARRWTGVYSQALDGATCWRSRPAPDLWVVTGPGGRGMTLAPALAEQTWNAIDPDPGQPSTPASPSPEELRP
jgi:FAD dependent oxidoreductase TIGR03364